MLSSYVDVLRLTGLYASCFAVMASVDDVLQVGLATIPLLSCRAASNQSGITL